MARASATVSQRRAKSTSRAVLDLAGVVAGQDERDLVGDRRANLFARGRGRRRRLFSIRGTVAAGVRTSAVLAASVLPAVCSSSVNSSLAF